MQSYDYGISVHFEATCWKIQPTCQRNRGAEIIEFTAVLFNLKTAENEAKFQKYVKPTLRPTLSGYCTSLTGISQDEVDKGLALDVVLQLFDEWLRKELTSRNLQLPKMSNTNENCNVIFIAWTDWEFDICLAKECQRKGIKMPEYFKQFIDLNENFKAKYNIERNKKFIDVLKQFDLGFKGSKLFGMDDAKYLAALASKMVCDGAVLAITRT